MSKAAHEGSSPSFPCKMAALQGWKWSGDWVTNIRPSIWLARFQAAKTFSAARAHKSSAVTPSVTTRRAQPNCFFIRATCLSGKFVFLASSSKKLFSAAHMLSLRAHRPPDDQPHLPSAHLFHARQLGVDDAHDRGSLYAASLSRHASRIIFLASRLDASRMTTSAATALPIIGFGLA